MTILITGGTGLVGQDLVIHLVSETFHGKYPHKIRLLVRNKKNNPNRQRFLDWCEDKGIDVFVGDLRNDDDVLNFSNVSDPENSTIIHCGAIFNFWQPFDLIYDVNVNGTKRVLNAFHKNNLKKLIYLSSAAVYGKITGANGRGVTEDQPIDLNQRKSYELSKAEGENLVREYLNQNPNRMITILRPTGIVGGSGTTTDLFARMFIGRFVPLPRGGKDKLSLVDVKDVTASIIFFMDSVRGKGEAYNVVSFTASLREVIQELGDAIGKKKARIISIPLFVFKPIYYLALMIRFFKKPNEKSLFLPVLFDKLGKDVWIDHSKLISTGFQPKVTLTESMIKIEQFITNNVWYAKEKFGFAL